MKLALYSVLFLSAIGGIFFFGMDYAKKKCENQVKAVIIEAVSDREVIEHENKNIDRDAIIRNLDRNNWLRNGE